MLGIGIDIGGTFVKFFVMNEERVVLEQTQIETNYAAGVAGFVAQIGDFINQTKQKYAPQQIAVAVGVPGDVDNERGILRYTPNLKFQNDGPWPLARQIYDYTGILPALGNDATVAAWGVYEAALQRQGTNVLVVTLGTGVGGGLILNKELYQGSNGTAGEIGHMKIDDTQTGPVCGCGAHGCLEAFVGTIGIKRRVLESVQKEPNSILAKWVAQQKDFKISLVSKAAEQGCTQALKIWEDTGRYLGVGISNAVLLLDLDTIVLTGGVSGAAPYFMPALEQVLANQQFRTPFDRMRLIVSKDPNMGGIGAALYAIHRAQPREKSCD